MKNAETATIKTGPTCEELAARLKEFARAVPEGSVRMLEAEVKRRSSLMYRIKCRLPWCKEFYLSK